MASSAKKPVSYIDPSAISISLALDTKNSSFGIFNLSPNRPLSSGGILTS